jgi:cell wall-associated NlpC family hydrolase
MSKNLITVLSFIALLASCSSIKPISSANNKQSAISSEPATEKKNDIKFLDEITADPQVAAGIAETKTEEQQTIYSDSRTKASGNNPTSVENVSALQLKYSVLLNTEAEQIENTELLKAVDEWYGTRYRMGGDTKKGIDCSAFVQAVYRAAFSVAVPRTAFEQFKACNRISATELKEGDLLFFNTTGGVSHVGIYLRNNKFVHASSSRGVTVSDIFEPFYLKRFLGAGRIQKNRSLGSR